MSLLINIHNKKEWSILLGVTVFFVILIPLLNIFPSEDSFLSVPNYVVVFLGKFVCYAIVALSIDLIWGFTGILSLGHGVFFALGGYSIGMYLMRGIGKEGVYKSDLPDFMVFLDWKELPWFWYGFDNFFFACSMAILIPALLAFTFGFLAFRSKIKGVYFAIITQASTYALMLLFFRNNTGFGGNNGLTDFKRILGYSLQEPSTRLVLYIISVLVLLFSYLLCRYIVNSKLGRILTAIRDTESRVMFSGYNPLPYKLFVWTLSAVLCGIAGALYVPQVGIINPSEMQPSNSIEMAIWVAVGGRGTLIGAIVGAFFVNGAKSWFTVAYPELWLYLLGGLFIVTTLFFPEGLVKLLRFKKSKEEKNIDLEVEESKERKMLGIETSNNLPAEVEVDTSHKVILYIENVTVSFDGFKALDNLSLYINEGELRCIIGPNGAGKTTLMDVITAKIRPDNGKVFFGQDIDLTQLNEYEVTRTGIVRKFQKPTVFQKHTVFGNLELTMRANKSVHHTLFAKLSGEDRDIIDRTIETIGLKDELYKSAESLSHGQKQWLEIGMMIIQEPKLLLVDEPVAGMTHQETQRTAELLTSLAKEHSVVVVEHDMEFVRSIAKTVTVLHEGRVLAEGTMDKIQNDQQVIEVYLGT